MQSKKKDCKYASFTGLGAADKWVKHAAERTQRGIDVFNDFWKTLQLFLFTRSPLFWGLSQAFYQMYVCIGASIPRI